MINMSYNYFTPNYFGATDHAIIQDGIDVDIDADGISIDVSVNEEISVDIEVE